MADYMMVEATLKSGAKVQFACSKWHFSKDPGGAKLTWESVSGVYPVLHTLDPLEIVAIVTLGEYRD